MEDEIDQLRLQLRSPSQPRLALSYTCDHRQALAHCSQDRDELDRLRKILQQERYWREEAVSLSHCDCHRESSQRREREIEQMQQKNSDEIMKLNEGLRKAEQSRREAEIKLHPLQQRENDLAEELSRQKEKER